MKVLIIIPYFGKLPNYFRLWLKTVKSNSDFNWLLFTDDKTPYDYPPNLKCIQCNFTDITQLIKQKFDFKISIDSPYKLCDYRPAYGYIFSEYIKGYEFWGYGDLDLLYGDLSHFISTDTLNKFDRILPNGHLSLYRNSPQMNEAFMLSQEGCPSYKNVFISPDSFCFDEWPGITSILKLKGYKQYLANTMADMLWVSFKFKHSKKEHLNYPNEIFSWYDGHIYQTFKNKKGLLERKEFSYIHLQKRKMILGAEINELENAKEIFITPFSFELVNSINKVDFQLKKIDFYRNVICKKTKHYRKKLLAFFYKMSNC